MHTSRWRHFGTFDTQAEQLEKKKAYVRRFRERAAHVEQKMMEIEQTADSCANKLEFLHSSDKYKPTAHEAKLQEKRAESKDSRNELCLKLEDMQHRIGFLLETIFPDVAHPRGADVDEETTSEIDPDNARVRACMSVLCIRSECMSFGQQQQIGWLTMTYAHPLLRPL